MTEREEAARAKEVVDELRSRPVTSPTDIEIRTILVPIDGSGASRRALEEAVGLAETMDAGLVLLMVLELEKHISAFEQVSLGGYIPSEFVSAAYKYLLKQVETVPRALRARVRVEIGNPGEVITDVAAEEAAGLIVMGSRGMGQLGSIVGSVSHYVLTHAGCPVLITKGTPEGWTRADEFHTSEED